jgi:hypothetical protein
MTWTLQGQAQKTFREVTRLVKEVVFAPDFDREELRGFDAHASGAVLDGAQQAQPNDDPLTQDRWRHTSVNIPIPTRQKNPAGNEKMFTVDGFSYRRLTDVIRATFADPAAHKFHLKPFRKVS